MGMPKTPKESPTTGGRSESVRKTIRQSPKSPTPQSRSGIKKRKSKTKTKATPKTPSPPMHPSIAETPNTPRKSPGIPRETPGSYASKIENTPATGETTYALQSLNQKAFEDRQSGYDRDLRFTYRDMQANGK